MRIDDGAVRDTPSTGWIRVSFLVLAFLVSSCALQPLEQAAEQCTMAAIDAAWSRAALSAWELTHRDILDLDEPRVRPTIVFFDRVCSYRGDGLLDWQRAPHNGAVALPDGKSVPPQVASFAAPYDSDRLVFVAMALPTVWRASGVQSELGLETLMTSVLVHEMTHTQQFYYFAPLLTDLTSRYQLGDDLDDDVIQTRFEATPAFGADIAAERDLLFAAAASRQDAMARELARTLKTRIDARRATYFVGDDAKYAELEDVFLTLEGVAQFSSYCWLTHPRGGARTDEAGTLSAFRRGGRRWSQDEGLALFLVVDRLVPDWRHRAFAARPATALALLALAAK